jgi:hypothetical protein
MASKNVSGKKLVVSPGAAKSPSARKAAPSQRTSRSTALADSSISSTTQFPVTGAATVVDAPHEPVAAQLATQLATQAVAALAYSYWVARGCAGGSPEEDWLRAERELGQSVPVVKFSKATA